MDHPLFKEHHESIVQTILAATARVHYLYPWEGLEERLRQGGQRLTLIAYGSLINAQSWRSGHEVGRRGAPMVAFGVRRVFDYEMDDAACKRYGGIPSSDARGALNAYVEGIPDMRMYGLSVSYAPEEIPQLRMRETAYDLVPVACARLNERGELAPELFLPLDIAYVLACPGRPWNGRFYTRPHLRPHEEYYNVCAAGCAGISPSFLEAWQQTTYLADRVTTVARWAAVSGIGQHRPST
jgi:hypothetical protein